MKKKIILAVMAAVVVGIVATVGLTLTQTKVSAITLTMPASMNKGDSCTATPQISVDAPAWLPDIIARPLVNKVTDPAKGSWHSDNEACVAVDRTGMVTAVAAGHATITYELGGFSATQSVDVVDAIQSISAEEVIYVLEDGSDSGTANVTLAPASADLATLTYTIEDESIAKVDENGTVTGVSEGETTLHIVASSGITKDVAVVSGWYVENIVLDSEDLTLKVGDTYGVTCYLTPEDDRNLYRSAPAWGSSDTNVAQILSSPDGFSCYIVAQAKGSCTIECGVSSRGEHYDSITVTVK